MVGVPSLPVGQDDDARPRLPNHARDLQTVLPSILDAAVGKIQRPSPIDSQNLCRIIRFAGTIFRRAARAHFTLREVENARALPALRGFQQRAAAGLLDVVAVRGDGQHVQG